MNLCVNCKHRIPIINMCTVKYNKKIDPVTGKDKGDAYSCSISRKHSSLCGPEATYFKEK